jgi:hypothetical protein
LNEYHDQVGGFVKIFEFNKSKMDYSIGAGTIGFWFVDSSYLNLWFDKIAIVSRMLGLI